MTTISCALLVFLQAAPSPSATPPPRQELWLGTFTPYPGARRLCQQHVIGAGQKPTHIDWSLYATTDKPAKVVLFYASSHGARTRPGATTLTVSSKDERGRLSVHPVSSFYPLCGVDPSSAERTVIIVSLMIGPE